MNDIGDIRGFDLGGDDNLKMDQSIIIHEAGGAPFNADQSMVGNYRAPSMNVEATSPIHKSNNLADIKPHPGMTGM